jgi:alpha-D-ribose 1-methylphosphonate 5-triphosphate synthase subunit PhnL
MRTMDNKKKWTSPQSIIIMAIVLLIFVYIGIDMVRTKPAIQTDLKEMKVEYVELSQFLDKKIPEIDSTLKIQADQILNQGKDINSLNERVKDLSSTK